MKKKIKKCILCKRKRSLGSLFCKTCLKRPLEVKIKALGNTKNIDTTPHRYGRLPRENK